MAKKAKWRVGTKVPRNLYYGDEPVAMLATAELAQALAEKLNNYDYWAEPLAKDKLVAKLSRLIPTCTQCEHVGCVEKRKLLRHIAALIGTLKADGASNAYRTLVDAVPEAGIASLTGHAAVIVVSKLKSLESALQEEQQKVKDAQEAERSMRHSMDAAISDYGESQMKIAELEQKVKELTEQLRIHNLCAAHHGFPAPECPHCESKLLHAHLDHAKEQLQSEQQKRAEVEAENVKLKAELERASDNRPLHMYVWSQKPSWIAVAQAHSVTQARALILEQVGAGDTGDTTCVERDRAAEFIKDNTPDIWHGPNAEFELTDSAEVIEQVAYCERLQAELQTERALRVQAETERDSLKEQMDLRDSQLKMANASFLRESDKYQAAEIHRIELIQRLQTAQSEIDRLNSRKGRDD